jgi:hypothetical protein
MSIVLVGSTSGSITLQEPAVAGTTVLDLPAVSGTIALTSQLLASPSAVGQIPFSTNGSTYIATAKIVRATAVSASGANIDFTGIPSWVKRITVAFSAISTNGTSRYQVQLGTSGGFQTSGYTGSASRESGVSGGQFSTGFQFVGVVAASTVVQGAVTITNITGNDWVEAGLAGYSDGIANCQSAGVVSLSGTLDRVRITTVNGTDTYDAGTINILYE